MSDLPALRSLTLARGSFQWVRLVGVVVGAAWIASGQPVMPPLGLLALALLSAATLVILARERRDGRAFDLAESPGWLLGADALALAAWVLASSPNPTDNSWILFAAVGAEAAFRFGARGAAAAFALAIATRAGEEALQRSMGMAPSDPTRIAGEALATALLLGLFSAIVESYMATRRRAATIERVSASLAQTLDVVALASRLADGSLEVVQADYAFVVERASPLFRVVAAAGKRIPTLPLDVRAGLLLSVLEERRTVLVDDYRAWADAMPEVRAAGVRAGMATPIWVEDEVAAAFVVGRYTPRPFDGRERQQLEILAGHAAVAFRNAHLLARTKRLEELSRELVTEHDTGRLLQLVADAATNLLQVESASVSWLDPDKREGRHAGSGLASTIPQRWPERGARAWIRRERRLLVLPDYQSWDELNPEAAALGLRATVGAPVTDGGDVVAALIVSTTQRGRRFTESEIALIESLAASASLALRNARERRERERRTEHLALLNHAARAFSGVRDVRQLYETVYRATRQLVPTDSFYLSLYDAHREQHTYVLCMDEDTEWDRDAVYPLGDGPTSRVVTTGRSYVTLGAAANAVRFGNEKRPSLSAVHVPMRHGDRVVGVLSAQRYVENGYTEADVALLESLASHAAAAIENVQLLSHTHDLYMASVRALAAAVDARDPYTRSHSARTSALARAIADEMGLPQDEIRRVQLGALLHDIGKIGIPDAVLNKPGAFTHQERLVMMTHAALGGAILQAVEPLRELAPIVRHHHERFDGAGYPDGIASDEVPIASYVVAAADAFEVIVSKRAYKEAQTVEFAIEELRRHSGAQFHPDVVDAFLRVIERDLATGSGYLQRLGQAGHEELESQIAGPATLVEEYAATSRAHTRQLAILQRLAGEITAVLDIETLADRLLRIVCDSMAYENGFLATLSETGEHLVVRAAVGPTAQYLGFHLQRGRGISWQVLEAGRAINVPDVQASAWYFGPPEIRSSLVVPLVLGSDRVGVLGVESFRANAFGPDDEQLLTTVSHQLAAAIRVARLHQEAKTAAATDPLTGLANRRVFFERLEAEILHARQVGGSLCAAMVDVDELKSTNDTYGHRMGDVALQRIAAILSSGVRQEDLVARLGGDEFAVLFPGVTQLTAERVMRRLAETVAADRDVMEHGLPTISWGITSLQDGPVSADVLVEAADRAMYRHKAVEHRRASPPA